MNEEAKKWIWKAKSDLNHAKSSLKIKDFDWDRVFGAVAYIIGIGAIIFTVIMIVWAVLR